ncbi:MAG: LPS export ABC transporter periplasmic protein LptC [Gammaproteobacteria bacterium]
MTRWIIVSVLLFLLVLTSWIQNSLQEEDVVKVKDRGEPDSIMWDFRRSDMDESGKLKTQLDADLMKHFPLDGSVELERPIMEIYNKDETLPIHVTAESGWLSGDGEKLFLYGKVYIWRDKEGAQPEAAKEMEVITTDLKILLKGDYAETSNFVMMIQGQTKVTAVGMQANFEKQNLKLLKDVRGHYDNSPKH